MRLTISVAGHGCAIMKTLEKVANVRSGGGTTYFEDDERGLVFACATERLITCEPSVDQSGEPTEKTRNRG